MYTVENIPEKVKFCVAESPFSLAGQALTRCEASPSVFPCLIGNISNTFVFRDKLGRKYEAKAGQKYPCGFWEALRRAYRYLDEQAYRSLSPEEASHLATKPPATRFLLKRDQRPASYPYVHINENPLAPSGQEITVKTGRRLFEPSLRQQIRYLPGVQESAKKLYCSGDLWELYTFLDENDNPVKIPYGYSTKEERGREISKWAVWAEEFIEQCKEKDDVVVTPRDFVPYTDEQKAQERLWHLRKQKKTVRRLVYSNKLKIMWTLTFALVLNKKAKGVWRLLSEEEQRDRKSVQACWNNFLTSFRRWLKKQGIAFKFIKVLEKHHSDKTTGRKWMTYHIHFATDLMLNKDELQRRWGYGVVWYDDFTKKKIRQNGRWVNVPRKDDEMKNPAGYITKGLCDYIEKDFDEAETYKEKAFACSQSLERPQLIRDEPSVEKKLKESNALAYTVHDKTYDLKDIVRAGKPYEGIKKLRYQVFNFAIQRK